MNATTMTDETCESENPCIPTVTVGVIKSRNKGEIILVYLNNDGGDPITVRYERLSRKERRVVQVVAQDPLHVLDRVKTMDRTIPSTSRHRTHSLVTP